jgi:hypothetical protein
MNMNNDIYNDSPEGPDPYLNRQGNKNPFRTDAGYFDSFAEKMMGRINEFEELSVEAPVLSSIPRYNPFEVPADYFEELPTIIQQKSITVKSGNSFAGWVRMIFRPNFALPVICIIAIAFAGIRYLNNNNSIDKISIAEELTIDEQLLQIDESTIIDALASVSVPEIESDPESALIEDYLLENDIDELNLNNEL